MNRLTARIAGLLIGVYAMLLRVTCRVRLHNDQREQVVAQGNRYVFGTLHSHQIGGMIAAEPGTGAMVSRSNDGELVVPTLTWSGHVAIRGSSGTGRKGGATALQCMIKHVLDGNSAMLAVDGPRGPRGSVQKGIGLLAQKTNAAVMMVLAIPSRRWVLRKTWDQFQIPKPFSTINVYISDPLLPHAGESLEHFAKRIAQAVRELEEQNDPLEVATRRKMAEPSVETRAAA